MHNSYFFLKQVAVALDARLKGYTLVSCFSQSRDELLVEFNNAADSFFIRASLLPELQSLSFPSQLNRARKNSVDLFHDLLMRKVLAVRVIRNDRSMIIELNDGLGLLFKMHGNQSNVICTRDQKAIDVFRNSIVQDQDIVVSGMDRELDLSEAAFQNTKDVHRHFFTFGKEVWAYLNERDFDSLSQQEQWKMLVDLHMQLESGGHYFHVASGSKLIFSLLPFGKTLAAFTDPLGAVTAFVSAYSSGYALERERERLISRLEASIKKTHQYLAKTEGQYNSMLGDKHFQVWGDLLMANLQNVKEGESSVALENLYEENAPVQVKLNPKLSPQKNAEAYYRKAKNRGIELGRLEQLLRERRLLLAGLEHELVRVKGSDNLKELRSLSSEISDEKSQTAVKLPYREVVFRNYRIWIGRDAVANDELTFKLGFKEDLWLHARDVSGSHVLIKHQAGKNFPKDVIERAAELAAFYSKRKTDTLCPVAVTPRKFVRKRKGDPAGAVVVEKEKVVMVEPKGID